MVVILYSLFELMFLCDVILFVVPLFESFDTTGMVLDGFVSFYRWFLLVFLSGNFSVLDTELWL